MAHSEYRSKEMVSARQVEEYEYVILPAGGLYVNAGEWVVSRTDGDKVTWKIVSDDEFGDSYESTAPKKPATESVAKKRVNGT